MLVTPFMPPPQGASLSQGGQRERTTDLGRRSTQGQTHQGLLPFISSQLS